MMPAPASAASPRGEKPSTAPSWPVMSAARKNNGTPRGTVIAMARKTDPVSTPRRTLALLKANVAAEQLAKRPPSTQPPASFFIVILGSLEGALGQSGRAASACGRLLGAGAGRHVYQYSIVLNLMPLFLLNCSSHNGFI